MPDRAGVRLGWLKGMYIYTIVGAGGFGLGIILMPDLIRSLFGMPGQDPVVFGVFGSVYLAFAILSVFGLGEPLKFAPVLLLQLCYKIVWFIGIVLPMLVKGTFPLYGMLLAAIFITYIVGDLIAIPFSRLMAKETVV